MKRPEIEGIDPDIQNYIWWLEGIVNSHSDFDRELSNTLQVLSQDLKLANSGSQSGYKLLSGNKDDKIFERIMTIIKMKSQMKNIALVETEETTIKKKKTNSQDFVLKK